MLEFVATILLCAGAYWLWRWHKNRQVDTGALSLVINTGLAVTPVLRSAARVIDRLQEENPHADDRLLRDEICSLTGDQSWSVMTVGLMRSYPGGASALADSLERRYRNARDALERGDFQRAAQILQTIESEAQLRETLYQLGNMSASRLAIAVDVPRQVNHPSEDRAARAKSNAGGIQAASSSVEGDRQPPRKRTKRRKRKRPPEELPGGIWICPKCSSVNERSWRVCDSCFQKRPRNLK